ncbi:sensor histidine kinase [Salipaludibacillus sp. HK11]|uniref:sensor histidine kinase n=1 Tax=Salipaludibacillus sp. HK11 TaxID=3394320 RepID=UPI0039FC7BD3
MAFIRDRIKHNGLFIKLFFFTLIIIVAVSITITLTTLRMSERLFIDTFSITNEKVLNQITGNFESFNYSIVSASNHLQQNSTIRTILTREHTNADLMNAYYHLNNHVDSIKANLDTYEAGIMLVGMKGISFSTQRPYWQMSDEDWSEHEITSNTLDDPRRLMYQYYRPSQTEIEDEEQIIIASKALMERISGEVYGTVNFAMKEEDFRQFYNSFTSPGNDVYLMDMSSVIVSSNRTDLIGETETDLFSYVKEIETESQDYINREFMGKDHIILSEYLPFFDMYLINTIDREVVTEGVIDKKEIALLVMGIVFIALIIVFIFSRKITSSLSKLVKQIGNTPKHDFHQYVSVTGTYETRQIGNAFNSMLDELHEYVEQLMLSQKQKRNAELATLQHQINPHFLYNTLTSIKFMVQQGGKEDAAHMIHSFISLLQNTIGNVRETVTMKQEIENLKNYVFINQKRYGNRIKVNYFVAPECKEYHVPKLILQPFVENAFFHGFNQKPEGSINVMVWKEGDWLVCEVMDNGDGMEVSNDKKFPEKKQKKQQFSGIGIRNVHERIQLIYGEDYGVEISSKIGEGTKARMTLPSPKKQSVLSE